MILIVFKYLTPKGFRGITIYPFVFLSNKQDKDNLVFITHERIHLQQQLELLILPFYVWYVLEFLIRLVQYKNRREAYYNICFEREAYRYESDFLYLKKRKKWSFLKFLKKKS
ncbi:hypothetical protein Q361_10325 [Flavobacterium croceum DSM 17960]|uniref:DUF4157 domain-containing protein n=1 Tax=Flavobacterium croceum DSM 17960 TaxID=1121886 RepID=A0A2S4N9Z2_9FLAO|nr:hypothetical protein [Flavobacterium croceum]POS02519.1 hypothetical protein Q361_10325 [Flavobacterium croceum DSM 17960]